MRCLTETPAGLVTALTPPPESSGRTILLEDDAGGQPMPENRSSLRMILDGSPPAPTTVECADLNRMMKRFSGQASVFRGQKYQTVANFLWWKLPEEPQPQHRISQSKRQWESAMQEWRQQLGVLSLEANAAVVILQQWFIRQWLLTPRKTLNSIANIRVKKPTTANRYRLEAAINEAWHFMPRVPSC